MKINFCVLSTLLFLNPVWSADLLRTSFWDSYDNIAAARAVLKPEISRFERGLDDYFTQEFSRILSSGSKVTRQDTQNIKAEQEKMRSEQSPVNKKDKNGQTLLIKSVCGQIDPGMTLMLLDNNANPNLTDDDGNSALTIASMTKWCEVIGPNSPELEYENETCIVRLLCNAGAFVQQTNQKGDYPLKIAIENKNFHIARILYQFGAYLKDPDLHLWDTDKELKLWKQKYDDGISEKYIWELVDSSNTVAVRSVLKDQISRFEKNLAKDFGQMCERIFSSGSDTMMQDIENARIEQEKKRSEQNPVNQRNKSGQTLLIRSVYNEVHPGMPLMLLGNNANPNLTDDDGNSALTIASMTDWPRMIGPNSCQLKYKDEMRIARALCDAGAFVQQTNQKGDYPLKIAIENKNFYIARILYQFGAYLKDPDLHLWDTNKELKFWKQGYDDGISKKYIQISFFELVLHATDKWGFYKTLPSDSRAYFDGITMANLQYFKPYIEQAGKMKAVLESIKPSVQEDVTE